MRRIAVLCLLAALASTSAAAQAPAKEPATEPAKEKTLWQKLEERLSVSGDMRLRHESQVLLDDQTDRHRERVRLRLGVNYLVADELLIGLRMTTGDPSDQNSPYLTLDNLFQKVPFSLDRIFATYRPRWAPGFWVTAGKFGHPFYANPVYGELVWDADVQPEGLSMGYTWSGKGFVEQLGVSVGGYTVLEQKAADDAMMFVAQVSTRLRLSDHLRTTLAVGYYLYSDTAPGGANQIVAKNSGNALTPDGKQYLSQFGILNSIFTLTYDGWALPLTLSGEHLRNTRAHSSRDSGWAGGLMLGQEAKRGDWRFYYQWQLIEQDAVFSPFTNDDFLFHTNHRSHVFGINYQFTNSIGIHGWALVSEREVPSPGTTTDSRRDQWVVRLDLNFRFPTQ